eukprot:6741901-Alexandrium_andersonii.AAC.1
MPKTPWNKSYDKLPARPKAFKKKMPSVDEMKRINAMNLEPSGSASYTSAAAAESWQAPSTPAASVPAASVPGKVQPPTSPSQEEQRGQESFKGDNSNSQSTSGK